MSRLKTFFRRIKYALKHNYLSAENIVLLAAIIMCLTWTFQSIKAMSRNWELNDRLNTEQKALDYLKVEIETAELENEYYRTDEYQELAARRFLEKQLPGEKMVVLPENTEVAKNKHLKESVATEIEEKDYSNFEKWMMFLLP